jgi:dihydroxy-acid dehydratase
VVSEVLGMSVTGCATTPALDPAKKERAYESGKRVVELIKKDVRPRRIMTEQAFENAVRADMAMGGSTNAVLHIPAVAAEAGVLVDLEMFDRIAKETPHLCAIIPAGAYEMADIHRAGGVPAVLNRLRHLIKDSETVNDRSIARIAARGEALDADVIRPFENPYHPQGGIAVLKGNIARSAVIKQTAVEDNMQVHSGPARVFYTEKDLLDAIESRSIAEGDVIVLPFQGPCGAPGMPEMLTPTDAIKGAGYTRVALITDGRFSGATSGPCVGHMEMEAFNGGPIGAIADGDVIEIDIPGRGLNVRLSDAEIEDRLKHVRPPKRETTSLLRQYRDKFRGKNCYGQP